ncbi:hypothetical protein PHYSODRAFT_298940 [Phytophthora sojae]|uniref:C2H2-type domain-containing protein n=1 Tax=Phytophthora sojae (strain P6497) TaxID=1094619 RepID=G4Z6X8_PHYSP|nr:hypothetical protein PHYSODRAFT_298940 [Phytophthora sojae]EGZ21032.1 hypothetical protein PHYSODRAFT_298940 [Phytophthora sojae]|eukprot:XP_009523749.1 hypothetical protein PHYSODRAFT_298940 [Phytophthora sojae]
MDISELLADSPEYVCETCLHDFARSDHLRLHQRRSCRGVPSQPCQLCEICWQWVKGNRHHLGRHQRGSRCLPLGDRIARRNQVADARRQRDAAWHRQRRQQRRDQATDDAPDDATEDSPNAPALSLATNSRDHEEASGSAEPLRNQLDDLLYSSDGEKGDADRQEGVTDDTSTPVRREDVLDLLEIADFEWNEIDLGAPPPERQEDQAQGDSQEQDGQDRVEDAAENVQWRDGVTDCNICLFPLDSKIWVCERETCRQPYHRECVKEQIAIDARCSNRRAPIHLDVEDDEVLVVRHVDAPPTCTVYKRVVTGTMLEGPQCSHIFDYDCLVQYNAQFLGNLRSRDLKCLVCNHPFPIPSEFVSDESDAEDAQAGYRGNGDNAFDYTEDQESSQEEMTGGVTNDENVVEYHQSDFDSSSDSDGDYNPGDEA